VLKPAGVSLHEAVGALRLDFANRLPGGAVLANGCVQEEILFSICPELVAARLYCPALRANEALLLRGAEQFSTPHGYGLRLEHGGPFRDPAPVDAEGLLQSHFLAVDAGDFRLQPDEAQFTPEAVRRDLDKLWAGLGDGGGPAEVATGNWGCGAFQGDVELKFLIQWAALSRAGRTMLYYPFQEARIVEGAPAVVRALLAARLTVGQLARFLLLQVRPGPVFQQALEQWPPPR
jgi:poly(ADP-ribose) glycohydrolase